MKCSRVFIFLEYNNRIHIFFFFCISCYFPLPGKKITWVFGNFYPNDWCLPLEKYFFIFTYDLQSTKNWMKKQHKGNTKNQIFPLEKTCISCQILCFLHCRQCAYKTLHFIVWILNIMNNYTLECMCDILMYENLQLKNEKLLPLQKVSIKQKM